MDLDNKSWHRRKTRKSVKWKQKVEGGKIDGYLQTLCAYNYEQSHASVILWLFKKTANIGMKVCSRGFK